LLYPLSLLILKFFCHSKGAVKKGNSLPKISIIVPTYNEACIIEDKLTSLLNMSYPDNLREIIVVDSGSIDGTCDIVRKFEDSEVVLLQQERRMGKASAINLALKEAKGEIIILSDANSIFGPDALEMLVKKFGDNVGGVQPRICPFHDADIWNKLFLWMHHFYKKLESNVDSVFFASGKLFAFRKALVSKIDEDAAADDFEIALAIRKRKFKVEYASDIKVVEKTPSTQAEARIQRVRRAFGILQSMRKNIRLCFNPAYGTYGLIIYPTHLFQMTFQPFLILLLLIIIIVKMIQLIVHIDTHILTFGAGIFICVFFSLFLERKTKKVCSIGYNLILTQIYVAIAICDLLRGKSYHIWKMASSTRDPIPKCVP